MSTGAKADLLEEFALVARALSAPARLTILESLAQAERAVDPLAARTGLSTANCSQHLQQLRRAGLVTSRRAGKAVIYRLADEKTLALMALLRDLAERNIGRVDQILRGLAGGAPPEPVGRDELASRLAMGAVTLLDIRPPDEFAAARIPGARNVSLAGLAALAGSLDAGAAIVAYCRGPYCVLAEQAVAELRRRGLDARRLDGGLPEWRAEGRPVETGDPVA